MTKGQHADAYFDWVVTVEFTIQPGLADPFLERLATQASDSLLETPAARSSISASIRRTGTASSCTEVYANQQAFADHMASAHFKKFDGATLPWVSSSPWLSGD